MAKQLIAIRMGFYRGDRIRQGQEFTFFDEEKVHARKDGKPVFDDKGAPVMVPVRAPGWAMPAENRAAAEAAIKAATPTNGDTKPAGAQKVAAKKARGEV